MQGFPCLNLAPTTVTIQANFGRSSLNSTKKKPASVDERQISFPTLECSISYSNQFPKFNRASLLGVQENKKSCKLQEDTHPMTRRHMPLDPNPSYTKLRHTMHIRC